MRQPFSLHNRLALDFSPPPPITISGTGLWNVAAHAVCFLGFADSGWALFLARLTAMPLISLAAPKIEEFSSAEVLLRC